MDYRLSSALARSVPRLLIVFVLVLGAIPFAVSSVPTASARAPQAAAWDMVGTTDQNLIIHTNPVGVTFTSAGDAFRKLQRGVDSLPFNLADDSDGSFPTDTLGIIATADTEQFFGGSSSFSAPSG